MKLNWTRGKNLGLALIYLGIMGIVQVIFIAIAQYGMKIGSKPITILIPLAVAFATFYSVIIIFESKTSITEYRQKRGHGRKQMTAKNFFSNLFVRPVLIITGVFTGLFLLSWLFLFSIIPSTATVFVINDNIAGIGCLLFATFFDKGAVKRTR